MRLKIRFHFASHGPLPNVNLNITSLKRLAYKTHPLEPSVVSSVVGVQKNSPEIGASRCLDTVGDSFHYSGAPALLLG